MRATRKNNDLSGTVLDSASALHTGEVLQVSRGYSYGYRFVI